MKSSVIIVALITMALLSCQSSPDFEELRSEILTLHKAMIDAHLNKDVDYIVDQFTENFTFVAFGDISKRTKDEHRAMFKDYLSNTTFSAYQDISEPVIRFSKDTSSAWSIVKVRVAGSSRMDDGSTRDFDVVYAWITLYERRGDNWIRTVEVSTNN
ncbi:hypothetical protein ACFL4T_01020 [candidate division KSB1 bacterium]